MNEVSEMIDIIGGGIGGAIAHDLTAWRRWDFADPIAGIRTRITGQDPLGAYVLGLYLRAATGAFPARPVAPAIVQEGPGPARQER